MTMRITAAGVVAENPIRYIKRFNPPVAGFACGLFISDDLTRALKNVVTGGADATAVGTPTIGVDGTFADGSYIDTGVLETTSMTLIAVVQRSNAQVMFMGTASSVDSNQVALYTNGSSPRKPVFSAKATSSPAVVSAVDTWPTDPAAYEVIMGRTDAAAMTNSLYIPRTGERITTAYTGSRTLSGRNVMIGAGPSPAAAYAGDTTRGKGGFIATRAITNSEQDQMFEWIAKRIAGVDY